MIDVTQTVETKKMPRILGRAVRDEIWHNGYVIGYVEGGDVRIVDKRYRAKLVTENSTMGMNTTPHIYRLNDNDLEALKTSRY